MPMREETMSKTSVRAALDLEPTADNETVLQAVKELRGRARRLPTVVHELEFASEYADSDPQSARQHFAAQQVLRARGIDPSSADASQYADAADTVLRAWKAETNPTPRAERGAPMLEVDPDPEVHAMALVRLREVGIQLDDGSEFPVDQDAYDEAVRQAQRRLGK